MVEGNKHTPTHANTFMDIFEENIYIVSSKEKCNYSSHTWTKYSLYVQALSLIHNK